jgi:hypothetical protein
MAMMGLDGLKGSAKEFAISGLGKIFIHFT